MPVTETSEKNETAEPDYDEVFKAVSEGVVPGGNTPLSSVPDHLYHYTDSAGLLGILTNHSIWATDSRFLNDRTELIYAEDLAREIIQEKSAIPRFKHSAELFSRCLGAIGEYGGPNSFLFCLSEDPDSLSQWRGYAKDGRGFTVGFDGKELCKSAAIKPSRFGIRKVEYDPDIQRRTISILIDQIDEKLEEIGSESAIDHAQSAIKWGIFLLSYYYKHKSFRDEKEWRLVSVVLSNKIDHENNQILIRSRQDELVPYSTYKPRSGANSSVDKLMINRVGIGPGFSHGNQAIAARELISACGYDAELYYADTPFRRL